MQRPIERCLKILFEEERQLTIQDEQAGPGQLFEQKLPKGEKSQLVQPVHSFHWILQAERILSKTF